MDVELRDALGRLESAMSTRDSRELVAFGARLKEIEEGDRECRRSQVRRSKALNAGEWPQSNAGCGMRNSGSEQGRF